MDVHHSAAILEARGDHLADRDFPVVDRVAHRDRAELTGREDYTQARRLGLHALGALFFAI